MVVCKKGNCLVGFQKYTWLSLGKHPSRPASPMCTLRHVSSCVYHQVFPNILTVTVLHWIKCLVGVFLNVHDKKPSVDTDYGLPLMLWLMLAFPS